MTTCTHKKAPTKVCGVPLGDGYQGCQNEALPGLLFCHEHASRGAMAMMIDRLVGLVNDLDWYDYDDSCLSCRRPSTAKDVPHAPACELAQLLGLPREES